MGSDAPPRPPRVDITYFLLLRISPFDIMASGMGVRGTMGRCYGFFADYKDCTVRTKVRHAAGKGDACLPR